ILSSRPAIRRTCRSAGASSACDARPSASPGHSAASRTRTATARTRRTTPGPSRAFADAVSLLPVPRYNPGRRPNGRRPLSYSIRTCMRITVLGAGRVGRAIIRDLAVDGTFTVKAVDVAAESLAPLQGLRNVTCERADLSRGEEIDRVIANADLVVGAVAGHMGYAALQRVLQARRNVVDISFFDRDPFELDALAREQGVVAVVDCGVAPGCSNLILGHMESVLDETHRFACYVGGLPVQRRWPYEYRAPFSPIDVIEEYTRPARYRRDGHDVTLPALSERERIEVDGIGTLEAFNTDGLRTLLTTSRTPTMVEKTLRYPGHAELMEVLRETGFFRTDFIDVGGTAVRPLE